LPRSNLCREPVDKEDILIEKVNKHLIMVYLFYVRLHFLKHLLLRNVNKELLPSGK